MATITDIKLKRSATAGKIPLTTQLDLGEIAINTHDGKLYIKKDVSGTESIVLIGPASASDTVYSRYIYTATASQTTFTGADDNSNILAYDIGYADVYVNGVKLVTGTDFTATSGTSVVMSSGLASGDIVEIVAMGSGNMTNLIVTRGMNKFVYTATSSQTTFSGTDDNSATLAYTVDQIQVYFNGALLDASDYTASNGTSVVLGTAATTGDIITIIALYTDDIDYIGDLDVTGNLTVSGNATIAGNLTFGDASTDTVTFSADITSNILPDVDSTYTLGSNTQRWSDIYTDNVYVTDNVGIGTSSPDTLLHLHSSAGDTILTIEADSDNDTEHDNPQIHFLTDGGLRTAAITGGNATNEGAGYNVNALNLQSQTIRFLTSSDQDFNNAIERMRINSSGNVGIGTSSPARALHVTSGTTNEVARFESTDGTAYLSIMDNTTSNSLQGIGSAGDNLTFYSSAAERMRIDSNGNLLVGKTAQGLANVGFEASSTGIVQITRDGAFPLAVNRLTSDGDIISLRKDGTTVGSINTSGGDLAIGNADTGLQFVDSINSIRPFHITLNTAVDSYVDLGHSSVRWKDLYLSGGLLGDTLTFSSNGGSERMRIDSSGNVGIGASSLLAKLHVRPTYNAAYTGAFSGISSYNPTNSEILIGTYLGASASSGDYTGIRFQINGNSSGIASASIIASREAAEGNGSSALSFLTRSGTSDTSERMRITSTGNVGIGTDSPQYLGHFVNGDVAIVSTNTTNNAEKQSLLFGGASGEAAGLAGITGYRGASAGIGELIFKTNQGGGITEAMRIDSSGNVGIGTSSPSVALDVNGATKVPYLQGSASFSGINSGTATTVLSVPQVNYQSRGVEVSVLVNGNDGAATRAAKFIWVTGGNSGIYSRSVLRESITGSADINSGNRTISDITATASASGSNEILQITATHGGGIAFSSRFYVTYKAIFGSDYT